MGFADVWLPRRKAETPVFDCPMGAGSDTLGLGIVLAVRLPGSRLSVVPKPSRQFAVP